MASFRFGSLFVGCWALDLLLLSLAPSLRLVFDPLLLLLIFQGFRLSSLRFLWLQGLGLGLLKDLGSGGVFGVWGCAFALVGWVIASTRGLMEWEDPVVVAVFAGLFTLLGGVIHAVILMVADPMLAWSNTPWISLLGGVVLQGAAALWVFPRLHRFLKTPRFRLGS